MTWPQPFPPDDARRAFLVERYVSPESAAGLGSSAAGLAGLCAAPATSSERVRYLFSAYLPSEDTCFCLFRAPSSAAVRAMNVAGGFAFDRIIEAVLLHGGRDDPPTSLLDIRKGTK